MALWTTANAAGIFNNVYNAIYQLRDKAEQELLMYRETLLHREADILYDLLKACEWGLVNVDNSNTGLQNLISYTQSKAEGYNFTNKTRIYPDVTMNTDKGGALLTSTTAKIYSQDIVGVTAGAPATDATTMTKTGLIGKSIIVEHDGVILPVGAVDRLSYTFNSGTGVVTFSQPLLFNHVITTYTTV